uniref:lamina-associated polypeptide 2, isoforms beta/delta/epsilon/gamma-like isoform X1 n=1 Tax=Styela clava TaxID=7725 RepID=UPI00193A8785|nr:lamina-associated polypeptide 2, isoforms beta/delta/epsilon/gamma-like isoform X1 [Styela clava]
MPNISKPEKLTIRELKQELEKRGVTLPHPQAKKIEYVNLYKREFNLKKEAGFSSDDEPTIRITRSKIMQSESHNTNIKPSPELEMEKNLLVGDSDVYEKDVKNNMDKAKKTSIRISPRRKKRTSRLIEEYDGATPLGVGDSSGDEKNTPHHEVRVHLKKLDIDQDDMTVDEIEITALSDADLRSELQRNGINAGPIVASTRRVYEKRLEKLLSGAGDSPISNGGEKYSDEESSAEEEEEEPVVMETRKSTRTTTLQYSANREFSSAPNLTALKYQEKPSNPAIKRSPPISIPKSKPLIKKPTPNLPDSAPIQSPAWVNISMTDDVNKTLPAGGKKDDFRSQSFHTRSYDAFQRGVHTDKKHSGGLQLSATHNSYIDVVNQSTTVSAVADTDTTMSSLRLDETSASDFSVIENDLEATLKNAEDVLNSTEISLKSFPRGKNDQPYQPSTSHLTRDLLSPNLSKLDYAKRIQRICGSATRRRPMRSQHLERREEGYQEDTVRTEPVPAPSSGEKTKTLKSDRRWIPVWVQILIVILLAVFFYLVVQSMESNPQKKITGL